jgi:hypothetical protein
MMKRIFTYTLIVLLSWACKNRSMTPEAYVDFAQKDEEINKMIDKGEFKFKCSYRPISYMAITEMSNQLQDENAKLIFAAKLKEMGNGFYISITISNINEVPIMLTNNGDKMLIPIHLQSPGALKDIELKTKDGLSYNPLQLIFNNQGNSPVLSMILVFGVAAKDLNQPFSITYNNAFWGAPEKITWDFGIKPLDFEREITF